MATETFQLRIPVKKLMIGLLLTVIPISLAGLLAIHSTERSLEAVTGSHFRTITESAATEVSNSIHGIVRSLGSIAIEPEIVNAAAASNRAWSGMPDKAIASKIEATDKQWNTPSGEGAVKSVISSPAAQLLRRHRDLDPRILRVTVTDGKGATVASTDKTEDYYQADEEYWQNIYAAGRGAISVTDILFDPVTKSYYIGVGLPLSDPVSNQFIGTMDVLVDVSSVYSVVNRVQLGPTARLLLVKDDGTVIASPTANLADKLKSVEYAEAQHAMSSQLGREQGYITADLKGGKPTLIGFADTGLRRDYRNLGWVVLLAQDSREALAASRSVARLMAFISAIGIIGVTLLAVFFSLHKQQDFVDLHELENEAPQTKTVKV